MFKDPVEHTSRFIQNYTERLLTSFEEKNRKVRLLGVEYLDAYFLALGVEEKVQVEEEEEKSYFVVFCNTLGEYNTNQEAREITKIKDSIVTIDGKKFLMNISQDEEGNSSFSISKLPDLDSN